MTSRTSSSARSRRDRAAGRSCVEQRLDPLAGRPQVGRQASAPARVSRHSPVTDWVGRVQLLQLLALAEVHVHAARQARVEAAHRAHDVDALEVLAVVLLEDRLALHRVLVRAGRAVAVARVGVPRRRRVRVVVGDLAVPDHHVVRQHAADRLGEAAADALVGHLERLPRLGVAGADLGQRLLDEVQRAGRGVGLEVGAGPVALDRVAPLRDLPLEARPGP